MDASDLYTRRLRRFKWTIFGTAMLLLAVVESRSHLMRGMPLIEGLVDWLIGVALAGTLVEVAFRIVARLQGRLQAEVAERARAEQELRESERRFRQLAENVREVFWLRTPDRFLYVSPAYEEIWGRSRRGLYTDPSAHLDALLPEDRERILAEYDPDNLLSDEVFAEAFRIVRPDGTVRWIQTKSFPVRNEEGEVDRRAGISTDVTEQVRAEQELRRHNRELALLNRASQALAATLDLERLLATFVEETRHLLDAVACTVWLLDLETEELVCQQTTGPQGDLVRGWRLAPGESLANCVARSGESLIVPDAKADDRHFMDVDQATRLNLRSILAVPLKASQDIVGVIQVLDTEVNHFQPADQALLEPLAAAAAIAIDNARLYQETDRLRAFNENIVQSMQEGILLEDATGHITFVNPAAADLLGYARAELVGQYWTAIVPPECVARVERESSRRPQGIASRYETALLAREGTRVPVIVSARPLFESERSDDRGPDDRRFAGVLSVFTNISERVRAERELRASEEQYRELVEDISDVIYAIDGDGVVTYVSPVIQSLTGYTPSELIGHPFSNVIHPEDLQRVRENYQSVLSGQAQANEYRLVTRSAEIRWARTSSRPMLDDGHVVGVRGVLADVTGRVRAEQEQRDLEVQLERARRIESLATLAGGVAHDLNNLLGPMVAYPDLILEALPGDSPIRKDVLQVQRSAEKAVAVVRDLLALARRGVYRMAPLNLNHVVGEYLGSASLVELAARHLEVVVDVDLDPGLPNIRGSAPHLSKVLMNLVTNAFEAMPHGGRLAISTSCESLDRPHAGYEHIGAGDYVILRVGDTGVGIEEEDLPRIFEPFYTRKEMGRSGTGLGLAVVYGVAHDHMARIDVATAVGRGTELSLYFPVCREAVLESTEGDEDYRGCESVLVVDDLEEQRTLAVRLLSFLGYRVHVAESGRAAVAYLRDHSVDILILDLIMQDGFDGLDTYREIIRTHPGQKAVIASGFSRTRRAEEAQRLGVGPFIRKPYTLQGLGRAVRRELDRAPDS
jgi:PAS domain S-box-containing protein